MNPDQTAPKGAMFVCNIGYLRINISRQEEQTTKDVTGELRLISCSRKCKSRAVVISFVSSSFEYFPLEQGKSTAVHLLLARKLTLNCSWFPMMQSYCSAAVTGTTVFRSSVSVKPRRSVILLDI